MPTMIFKSPGPHLIHGVKVEFRVIDDEAVPQAEDDGWSLTAIDAGSARTNREKAAAESADEETAKALANETPPTREELEQMATKIGIPFSARVSDKKLRALIETSIAKD